MSYTDEPQTPDMLNNPRVITALVIGIAALVLIIGCVAIYFFVNRGASAVTQGTLVVQVPTVPSPTPSLTPIPTETLSATATPQEGTGGGGDGEAATPIVPAIRFATLAEPRGSVLIKSEGLGDWTPVTRDISIPQGTTILTSENSSAKLSFTEGTVVRISSQTQLTLQEMTGTTLNPITRFKLDFGKVWTIVPKLGTGSFDVDTPLGTASVEGTFMGVEHNSTELLDIITCLEGRCRYTNNQVGVQRMTTEQQFEYQDGAPPGSIQPMNQVQLADWAPTKVPEVLTLTPTATPTASSTSTRTPTLTRTPSNTPNVQATENTGGTRTAIANTQSAGSANQTATANSANLTSTVFFFNVTATALFQSTSNSFTATSFAFTATSFQATSNAIGTSNANTATSSFSTSVAATATAAFSTFATQTAAASATNAAATVTQAAIPVVSFNPFNYTVNESDGQASLTVTVSTPVPSNISVNYTAAGFGASPASSPADFTPASGTLIIPANNTSGTINFTIVDDGLSESNEVFQVTLSSPTRADSGPILMGANSTATVTIVNTARPTIGFSSGSYSVMENDSSGVATITVNLSRAYANTTTVTVNYSSFAGGTAVGGGACGGTVDYINASGSLTFSPTEISKTFTVAICNEVTYEANETVFLQLTGPVNATSGVMTSQLTINNDDPMPSLSYTITSAGGSSPTEPPGFSTSTVDIAFTLSPVSGLNVTFNYATVPNTASEGLDYTGKSGTLTILAGSSSTAAPLQITLNGDALHESPETFSVNFSGVTNATLTSPASLTITIQDDGDPAPVASFSASPYTTTEGNSGTTAVPITVNFNRQSGQTVILGYSSADGGAGACGASPTSAGVDYAPASGTLVFNPGEISKSFTVTVYGDTTVEPHECLTLTLSQASGNVTFTSPTAELWIFNDD